tara:strand:- start:317 stop:766 length:450 start_codon:yes stop_codon:yes gene_type:complete
MKGNPIQRNFFQRVLGLGKKSKRPRTATSAAQGGFVGAVGQAPAATQGAGSFVSALGMKSPVEKGHKKTVSYPSAQIEMENRTGTRGMIRGTRTEVVKTKGGGEGKKKGKGKKMKLRGSGRKKTTSVRNLVTGGKNITSGRTGRTRRRG